jgi:DNA-binding Lrp family transcriptional regulator
LLEAKKMLDKKELVIMSMLRQNSRETLTKMSRRSQIPVSTIYDKIKLHENGIIKRHTCILDFAKLGFNTRANICLKVNKENRDELRDYLLKNQSINSVYKINNGFDFLVEAVFKHIKDLEDFLEMLDEKFKLKGRQVFYIIDDIKRESFMADPMVVELVGA